MYTLKLSSGNCPDILKYLDITPFLKQDYTMHKSNYRPISTLSHFSKVFEKLIFTHICSSFMKTKLSISLASFHKTHIMQYALLKTIETWDSLLSKGNKVGAIVMGFVKSFDMLNSNSLPCKLKNLWL